MVALKVIYAFVYWSNPPGSIRDRNLYSVNEHLCSLSMLGISSQVKRRGKQCQTITLSCLPAGSPNLENGDGALDLTFNKNMLQIVMKIAKRTPVSTLWVMYINLL